MALTTLDAVAAMLRWGEPELTKYSAGMALYIAAASQVVEDEAGPFEARTVEHIADGAPSIALPFRVSSVTDVSVGSSTGGGAWVDGYYVPGGTWGVVDGWILDKGAGILHGPFPRGRSNVRVTFVTGFAEVPEAATLAATMVAVDMWAIASQRAPGLDDQVDPVYLMPKVVRNLLEQFKATQMPGFA